MTKTKHQKNKQSKNKPKPRGKIKQGRSISVWPIIKALIKMTLTVVGTVSAIFGILSLFSDISVEALKPLQRGDLKSTPIQITNNSFLAIHDVSYICKPKIIKTDTLNVFTKEGITGPKIIINKLERGESATIRLPFWWLGGPVILTDFDLTITYKTLPFMSFMSEKSFRFASASNSDGEIILLKRAISEN
jgi:hypothetical protein